MHIISKFHDFYDIGLSQGVDKTIVYERHTEEIDHWENGKVVWKDKDHYLNLINDRDTDPSYVIGFCGKFYPVIKVVEKRKEWQPDIEHFFFDAVSYIAYLKKNNLIKKTSFVWRWARTERTEESAEKFFSFDWEKVLGRHFQDNKVPIFVATAKIFNRDRYVDGVRIVLNPCLKDYKFMKVIDPYTAFQEIQMYLSGVLGLPETPMVCISDTKMRDKKGFDNRSFKKDPGQKKRGKKKK